MKIQRESFINRREALSNRNKITQDKVAAVKKLSLDSVAFSYKTGRAKKVSFGSILLFKIKLKKLMPNGKYDFIPGSFIQLFEKDPQDKERILELQKQWGDNKTKYGETIINDFLRHDSEKEAFFATEIMDPETSSQKITCLIKATNPENPRRKRVFKINFIQASPDIVGSKPQEIKGSGAMGMYGIVKLAKKYGFKRVTVDSTNNKFYKEIGLKKVGEITKKSSYFELERKNFKPFLKKNEEKYSLNKDDSLINPAKSERPVKHSHFRLASLIFRNA